MARIRPLKGTRYTPAAGDLQNLVAPPYDVLSPQERDEYAGKSPYNVVHLTLPEQKADDRSKYVKYARSAAALAEWRREEILAAEDEPVLYRYKQTFTVPGASGAFTRTALIGLLKIEPYDRGVVLPHEQTFPKHKEDRLRLLEATRSHLECIYGLFEDAGGKIFSEIARASAADSVCVTTEDGVEHVLDILTDAGSLVAGLAEEKVWIADGHHRYETALNFRGTMGERSELIPEDFMMMAFSSMSDPGLVLLPTHRIVANMPISGEDLARKLEPYFTIEKVPNDELLDKLKQAAESCVFGVALPGEAGLFLTLRDKNKALTEMSSESSERLSLLDVSILHQLIFAKILNLHGLEFFSYTRDPGEALEAVRNGAGAAFLMNPPSVQDMREIALGGEKMPQKSTYYYPKLLSGLVLWSLNDFQ